MLPALLAFHVWYNVHRQCLLWSFELFGSYIKFAFSASILSQATCACSKRVCTKLQRIHFITGYGKNVHRVAVKPAHNVMDRFTYKIVVLARLIHEVQHVYSVSKTCTQYTH